VKCKFSKITVITIITYAKTYLIKKLLPISAQLKVLYKVQIFVFFHVAIDHRRWTVLKTVRLSHRVVVYRNITILYGTILYRQKRKVNSN